MNNYKNATLGVSLISAMMGRTTGAARILAFTLLPSLAWSQQVFTEDVVIENTDPALIFDDSTSVDGFEYVIRGRDEYFSVENDVLSRTYLYFDTALRSAALGDTAVAAANNGTALGRDSWVSAVEGVAAGFGATSYGIRSSALGSSASAGGINSVAIGYSSSTFQNASIAVGAFSEVSGANSIAIGPDTNSADTATIAIGSLSTAAGNFSTALGYQANTTGESSAALGFVTKAFAPRSTAIGFRAFADQPDTVIVGAIDGVNGADAYSNIGIGTSAPTQAVDVERSGAAARFQLTSFTAVADEAPQYIQRRSRGTPLAPTSVLNNDNLGLFSFRGHNGTAMGGSRATFTAQAAGNFTASSTPTRLIFATTPVGQTAPVQVMVITPDGKVQVNGQNLSVPDYVFEDDYALMPLKELKTFIDENGHLPGMASAQQVKDEGLDLAGSQMNLLQKVEELTLYTLQQQDRIDRLEAMLVTALADRD